MHISTRAAHGVAYIGFERAEKKNALTSTMYAALAAAIRAAENEDGIAAILLHGQRDLFTAGNDLEDFLENPPGPQAPLFDFMQALSTATKPIVAAVNGPAIGIGCTMLLHCDLVYLGDDARLMLPFVQLGLCPEFASSLLLPAMAGQARAAEKLLLGDPITPDEALALGIATRVLPRGEVFGTACAQAERFAHLPRAAVQATKRLMKQASQQQVAQHMQTEASAFAALLAEPEAQAALSDFLARRRRPG